MWTNFWRDFNRETDWHFPEAAPAQLQELRGSPITNSAELVRVEWMWRRKPRLILGEGVIGYCVVVGVAIALLLVPGTGILFDLVWLVINALVVASDTVRTNRWRRDYESALDRLIRTTKKRETI